MTTAATSNTSNTKTPPRAPTSWQRIMRIAALATIVLSVAHQWLNRFFGISLVALAVLLAIGLLLDLSRRRAGPWLLLVTSILFLALHVAVLTATLRHLELAETFITVAGLVFGLGLTLVAAVQTIRAHDDSTDQSSSTAMTVAVTTCVAWAALGAVSVAMRLNVENVEPGAGDLVVDVSDAPPTAPNIALPPGGAVVVVRNLDDSPVVIESGAGDIHLAIPAHYSRRLDLDLDEATYDYTIDGPDQRIHGTLTVE